MVTFKRPGSYLDADPEILRLGLMEIESICPSSGKIPPLKGKYIPTSAERELRSLARRDSDAKRILRIIDLVASIPDFRESFVREIRAKLLPIFGPTEID